MERLRRIFSKFASRQINPYMDDYKGKNITIGHNVVINGADLIGNNVIGDDTSLIGNIKIGRWTTLGHHNIVNSGPSEITIGNFCQFGPYVAFYASYHPMTRLSSYQNGKFLNGAIKSFGPSAPIIVGSDIWIGHGSIILQGVHIGNGAIVGGGSVVTKDIPDYSIAVGNPARIINKRFSDRIIENILLLEWWKYDEEALASIKDIFLIDLAKDESKGIDAIEKAQSILSNFSKVEQ